MGRSDLYKGIIETLKSITKYDGYTVFADFVAMLRLEMVVILHRKDLAEESKRVADKYNAEEKEKFCNAMEMLMKLMESYIEEKCFYDVLGKIFHEMDMNSKATGQFFTPQHLADLCGMLAIDKAVIEEEIKSKGFFKVQEPACGGGAMILAVATAVAKLGYNPQKIMLVTACDIDSRCVDMCYVQLALYGIPAVVVHGNTLTLREWDCYKTPMYWLECWGMREAMKWT